MNQDVLGEDVYTKIEDGLGIIVLDRPKALNALSTDMIRAIAAALHEWRDNDAVNAVLFLGKGKAFCSGGDIKAFYHIGMQSRKGLASQRVPVVFFGEEYSLNKQIFHYPKPTIAVMDGFTMGGGYGIAGHCDVKVCNDNTVFAMPESGIGFFPDVGSMYHLNKCPRNYGRYLALTGQGVNAHTTCAAGLANMCVYDYDESQFINSVIDSLGADSLLDALKERHHAKPCADIPHIDIIEKAFAHCEVSEILSALDEEGSDFSEKTALLLRKRSPTSVLVTAKYLEKSQGMDFDEVIAMDFVLVQHFIRHADMYEGIRAQLIDKDYNPQWIPASFDQVKESDVNTYFTPTGYDLKDVQIF